MIISDFKPSHQLIIFGTLNSFLNKLFSVLVVFSILLIIMLELQDSLLHLILKCKFNSISCCLKLANLLSSLMSCLVLFLWTSAFSKELPTPFKSKKINHIIMYLKLLNFLPKLLTANLWGIHKSIKFQQNLNLFLFFNKWQKNLSIGVLFFKKYNLSKKSYILLFLFTIFSCTKFLKASPMTVYITLKINYWGSLKISLSSGKN